MFKYLLHDPALTALWIKDNILLKAKHLGNLKSRHRLDPRRKLSVLLEDNDNTPRDTGKSSAVAANNFRKGT